MIGYHAIMELKTLKDIKDLKGKCVLMRVDFNVPIDKRGVADDMRIKASLPTIKYLLKKKAKVILITHLGRPEGKVVDTLKLDAVAARLKKLLKKQIRKVHECIGKSVEKAISEMKDGEVLMLENIRFHPEEEACEPKFTKTLAHLGDIFVSDAFAACHRKHASTAGIADYLPAYAGFLVEQEIRHLSPLLEKPKKPLAVVMGGAKIDTKIGLIKSFFGKAKYILIGGGLANTFFAAQGYDIGKSFFEPEKIEVARKILADAEKKKQKIILPVDAVVADYATEYATTIAIPLEDVEGGMKILDIGPKSVKLFNKYLKKCKTIIWNGPLGLYEFTPFSNGTKSIAKTVAAMKNKAKVVVGGGDTIDALKRVRIPLSKFAFASTGGGAMLEFLEGKKLQGIEVLKK